MSIKNIFGGIVLIVFMVACDGRQDEMEKSVLEEFYRLKSEFIASEEEACMSDLLSLAEASVDSIILMLDIDPLKDSLYAPVIPERPEFVPVDSAVFINNSKSDTSQ